tara:strand:- start:624 stop:1076 length:453 start_codon:yes stop_codon:yes gene_type:complete
MEKGDIVICLNSNTASDLRIGNSYIIKSTAMMDFNEKYIRLEGVDFGHNSKFFKIKTKKIRLTERMDDMVETAHSYIASSSNDLRLGKDDTLHYHISVIKMYDDIKQHTNERVIEELDKFIDVASVDNVDLKRLVEIMHIRVKELEKINK